MKDTKFERAQHEATGKHQGGLRRFLRGIQDGQERDEREKQKAKAEIDRLNKVVGGSVGAASVEHGTSTSKTASSSSSSQASAAERKKQLAQLVDMGIAVPDEYRGDMALAGEWKVTSQRNIEEPKAEEPLSVGIRKRKFEGQEEEEEAGEIVVRRGWGSTLKRFPGNDRADTTDLDSLLSGVTTAKKEEEASGIKLEKDAPITVQDGMDLKFTKFAPTASNDSILLKREETTDPTKLLLAPLTDTSPANDMPDVVFKKRKSKVRK